MRSCAHVPYFLGRTPQPLHMMVPSEFDCPQLQLQGFLELGLLGLIEGMVKLVVVLAEAVVMSVDVVVEAVVK